MFSQQLSVGIDFLVYSVPLSIVYQHERKKYDRTKMNEMWTVNLFADEEKKVLYLFSLSPRFFDLSQSRGWQMSSISIFFENPFRNNGIVHAKLNIDKIFDLSRGFGFNSVLVRSIAPYGYCRGTFNEIDSLLVAHTNNAQPVRFFCSLALLFNDAQCV